MRGALLLVSALLALTTSGADRAALEAKSLHAFESLQTNLDLVFEKIEELAQHHHRRGQIDEHALRATLQLTRKNRAIFQSELNPQTHVDQLLLEIDASDGSFGTSTHVLESTHDLIDAVTAYHGHLQQHAEHMMKPAESFRFQQLKAGTVAKATHGGFWDGVRKFFGGLKDLVIVLAKFLRRFLQSLYVGIGFEAGMSAAALGPFAGPSLDMCVDIARLLRPDVVAAPEQVPSPPTGERTSSSPSSEDQAISTIKRAAIISDSSTDGQESKNEQAASTVGQYVTSDISGAIKESGPEDEVQQEDGVLDGAAGLSGKPAAKADPAEQRGRAKSVLNWFKRYRCGASQTAGVLDFRLCVSLLFDSTKLFVPVPSVSLVMNSAAVNCAWDAARLGVNAVTSAQRSFLETASTALEVRRWPTGLPTSTTWQRSERKKLVKTCIEKPDECYKEHHTEACQAWCKADASSGKSSKCKLSPAGEKARSGDGKVALKSTTFRKFCEKKCDHVEGSTECQPIFASDQPTSPPSTNNLPPPPGPTPTPPTPLPVRQDSLPVPPVPLPPQLPVPADNVLAGAEAMCEGGEVGKQTCSESIAVRIGIFDLYHGFGKPVGLEYSMSHCGALFSKQLMRGLRSIMPSDTQIDVPRKTAAQEVLDAQVKMDKLQRTQDNLNAGRCNPSCKKVDARHYVAVAIPGLDSVAAFGAFAFVVSAGDMLSGGADADVVEERVASMQRERCQALMFQLEDSTSDALKKEFNERGCKGILGDGGASTSTNPRMNRRRLLMVTTAPATTTVTTAAPATTTVTTGAATTTTTGAATTTTTGAATTTTTGNPAVDVTHHSFGIETGVSVGPVWEAGACLGTAIVNFFAGLTKGNANSVCGTCDATQPCPEVKLADYTSGSLTVERLKTQQGVCNIADGASSGRCSQCRGANSVCRLDSDCASGICMNNRWGTRDGTCSDMGRLGGAACSRNSECESKNCVGIVSKHCAAQDQSQCGDANKGPGCPCRWNSECESNLCRGKTFLRGVCVFAEKNEETGKTKKVLNSCMDSKTCADCVTRKAHGWKGMRVHRCVWSKGVVKNGGPGGKHTRAKQGCHSEGSSGMFGNGQNFKKNGWIDLEHKEQCS